MRSRLVVAFVGLILMGQIVFGVPRAFMVADLVRDAEQDRLERTAQVMAAVVEPSAGGALPVTDLDELVAPGEHLVYTPDSGDPIEVGSAIVGSALSARQATGQGVLVLSVDQSRVDDKVREALMPLLLIGGTVLALAAIAALLLARHLARPFVQLATAAEQLGSGRFDLELPRSDVREVALIADALQRSAARLEEMLHHERALAAHLSHELRTPLTALRLILEEAGNLPDLTDAAREDLALAVTQSERLTDSVTVVLDAARDERSRGLGSSDLRTIVDGARARWTPELARDGRRLVVREAENRTVAAPFGLVTHILDVLIGNAQRHGQGSVTVSVIEGRDHVRLRVEDEGTDFPAGVVSRLLDVPVGQPDPAAHSGLAAAAAAARSIGGRLLVIPSATTTLDLILPPDDGLSQGTTG